MDEKTPHLHLTFVPLTKDNRLCAKEIIGNRANLTKWQDDFHAYMVEKYPDLERGESASRTGRKHIPTRLFKQAVSLSRQSRAIEATLDGVSYDDKLVTYKSKNDNYSYATMIGNTQDQFVGVYKYSNITPDKYEKGYAYYGYDANRGGIFNFFSKEGARFKPFRAYLKIKETSASSKPFYYFVVSDDETTGIDGVSATTLTDDAPVYNLQGQLVRQAGQHTQLPKGLYIQKGRKFVQQ